MVAAGVAGGLVGEAEAGGEVFVEGGGGGGGEEE